MKVFRQWLVVALLALCTPPMTLEAQFIFTTNNSTISITSYTGSGNDVTIPATTNGYPVISIGLRAFNASAGLVSITIPSSVTNFAWPSFQNCTNLLAVYFQGNAVKDFFPAAGPIFLNDSNATLYYLQGTTGWGTKLDGLPEVQWDPAVLPHLVYNTNNGMVTITGYDGPGVGTITIPSTIHGLRVGSIGPGALSNRTSLTALILPNTVTNLGAMAFAGCTGLTGITIPNDPGGSGAFSNCIALAGVSLSGTATYIASAEFSGCTALTSIKIPAGIASIGDGAFQNCSALNELDFQGNAPTATTTVFDGANSVTNYYFPKTAGWGPTLAGRPAVPILFTYQTNSGAISIFRYIGIDGVVTIPKIVYGLPVTSIANPAFNGCTTVTNVIIGSNITSIAGQAFVGCPNLLAIDVDALNPVYSSLGGVLFDKNRVSILYYPGGRPGSYTIPDGVTSINTYAFQACPGLTSLTVPASVTSIGTLGFNADPNLTTIYFLGNAPNVAWDAFDIQNTVIVYYLPGATGWDTNPTGLPTALWVPQVQTGDASFGVGPNGFGFYINWASGQTVVVEASTSLANPIWVPVGTNVFSSSSSYFSDPQWTNFPGRFYRLRSP